MKLFSVALFLGLNLCVIAAFTILWPPKKLFILQSRDHFSPSSLRFAQSTLYEDNYWDHKGPILFYCGNEGPIGDFWNNTGFMFEYAREVRGFVIFAEHRYYGESMPFGGDSFKPGNLKYLTIAQALEDYVKVLNDYHKVFNIGSQIPVIVFGGSYGGILAGLMRLKYPHIVEGALASSAPFEWLAGKGHLHDMFKYITQVYNEMKPVCPYIIRRAYKDIDQSHGHQLNFISQAMKLCQPLSSMSDAYRLMQWSRNAFIDMAMMNYPYSSNFLANLPAAPLNISCERVSRYNRSRAIEALRDAVDIYYNSTGKLECFDIFKKYTPCADTTGCGDGLRSKAWDYQACTEMPLYDPVYNTSGSMFPGLPVSYQSLKRYCYKKWLVYPRFYSFPIRYSDGDFRNASNIIFSNGYVDPWRLGGILRNVSRTVVAFNIIGGAHHYDLRGSNSRDSRSVIDVRRRERLLLTEWIKNFKPRK